MVKVIRFLIVVEVVDYYCVVFVCFKELIESYFVLQLNNIIST